MKVKLTNIKTYITDKNNQPLLDKKSQPYTRVTIQTEQHGKTWLSGFAYQGSKILSWKIGDEVEIEVTQNGQWLNFSLPKAQGQGSPALEAKLNSMDLKLNTIIAMLSELEKADEPPEELSISPDQISKDEIPDL